GREGHEFPAREGLHRLVQDLTPIQARLPCDDFGHFLRALADGKFGGKPCLREMCTLQGTRRPDKTARLKARGPSHGPRICPGTTVSGLGLPSSTTRC